MHTNTPITEFHATHFGNCNGLTVVHFTHKSGSGGRTKRRFPSMTEALDFLARNKIAKVAK